jgi:putative FmdB family regulatory protein
MPTYEYQAKEPKQGCYYCKEKFEVDQPMSEDALTECPKCGQPIQRLISMCSVSRTQSTKSMLSDKNLKEKGFTKLVNEGGGKFRKTI